MLFKDTKVRTRHLVLFTNKVTTRTGLSEAGKRNLPICLKMFNLLQNCVDRLNQKSSYYRNMHISKKWWKNIFL